MSDGRQLSAVSIAIVEQVVRCSQTGEGSCFYAVRSQGKRNSGFEKREKKNWQIA